MRFILSTVFLLSLLLTLPSSAEKQKSSAAPSKVAAPGGNKVMAEAVNSINSKKKKKSKNRSTETTDAATAGATPSAEDTTSNKPSINQGGPNTEPIQANPVAAGFWCDSCQKWITTPYSGNLMNKRTVASQSKASSAPVQDGAKGDQ